MSERYHAGAQGLKERVRENIKEKVKNTNTHIAHSAAHFTGDVLFPRTECTLLAQVNIHSSEEINKDIQRYADEGYVFLAVSNHQSHFDGVVAKVVLRFIQNLVNKDGQETIRGAQLPFASSVRGGGQGEFLKIVSEPIFRSLENSGIHLQPYTRPKELQKLENEGRLAELKDARGKNIRSLYRMMRGVLSHGDMIITFPEASVQGGRKKKWYRKEVYGLQKAQPLTVHSLFDHIRTIGKGQRVANLCYTIEGSREVFSPNYRLPTMKGMRAVLGLGRADIISVRFSRPFDADELENRLLREGVRPEKLEEEYNDRVMQRIAMLMRGSEQGVYKEFVRQQLLSV